MSYAAEAIRTYFARTGRPRGSELDGYYHFEGAILSDMLGRLEAIRGDEGVEPETARRVIRCMLYGAPSPAAAEERMRRQDEFVKLLAEQPPVPFVMPADVAAQIGLPPQ